MNGELEVLGWGLAALASIWAVVWFMFLGHFSESDKKSISEWLKRKTGRVWKWFFGALLKSAAEVVSGNPPEKKEDGKE